MRFLIHKLRLLTLIFAHKHKVMIRKDFVWVIPRVSLLLKMRDNFSSHLITEKTIPLVSMFP